MTGNLTSGEYPSVLRMAAPLIISFWMRAVVTFIDVLFAAMLGDAAVAAIGLTIPFEFLMIAVWVGLSTGLTSALSRAMGAREGSKIGQYRVASWRIVWIVSPLFTLIGVAIWFGAPAMGIFESEVARSFQIYGTVLIGGSAFTSFWSIIPDSLVKAHHDTRSTMWAGIWTNLINVSLNTLFLFVFEWGIFGIALSTVLARIGGLWYALLRARYHEQRRKATWAESEAWDPAPYRRILNLAVPSSITFGLIALEGALVNALLIRTTHPTEAIAAFSIYHRVTFFALQPVIAIAVAILPFAATRFGAGDPVGARRGFRDAGISVSVYSLAVVGPLMLLAAPWIAERLAESELTAVYTTFALQTVPLACLAGSLFLLCRPVFEALNQGRPGLIMAVFRYLVLTWPLAWGGLRLAEQLGHPEIYGLVVGLLIAAAVSSLVFYLWLRAALEAAVPRQTT